MYASPVVYTTAQIPVQLYGIYMINPMAPIISTWRYAFLGIGDFPVGYWGISWITTAIVLMLGIILFSRVEKTFMDTV
jgi:lipopolysaccharide transport system permease protein